MPQSKQKLNKLILLKLLLILINMQIALLHVSKPVLKEIMKRITCFILGDLSQNIKRIHLIAFLLSPALVVLCL